MLFYVFWRHFPAISRYTLQPNVLSLYLHTSGSLSVSTPSQEASPRDGTTASSQSSEMDEAAFRTSLPKHSTPGIGNGNATNEELLEMVGTVDITPGRAHRRSHIVSRRYSRKIRLFDSFANHDSREQRSKRFIVHLKGTDS
ncbi:hypothetical protein XU18_1111 [Perkinsela sp. CCAP 1560/4]|nr:hypothetical protein XU18_3730 [Perkinsela sp. CCAP 1560/4]KNH08346.1 hypothetical protein XU18_1111 [Perkinsela sp. CCAP 1560/4]|eukprot:KNH05167.1 hypothetical protein XU18_3730 [Perkinsela sp. CCAP 1560/4]